jgi:hypothetical protein
MKGIRESPDRRRGIHATNFRALLVVSSPGSRRATGNPQRNLDSSDRDDGAENGGVTMRAVSHEPSSDGWFSPPMTLEGWWAVGLASAAVLLGVVGEAARRGDQQARSMQWRSWRVCWAASPRFSPSAVASGRFLRCSASSRSWSALVSAWLKCSASCARRSPESSQIGGVVVLSRLGTRSMSHACLTGSASGGLHSQHDHATMRVRLPARCG